MIDIKISLRYGRKCMSDVENELKDKYNIDIIDDETMYSGNSGIMNKSEGNFDIYINKHGYNIYSKNMIFKYIDTFDFINYIRALYHEEQHIIQSIDKLYSHDDDAIQMAMKNFACEGNPDYYNGSNSRYNNDLAEIDAERAGVLKTYQFLKDNVTDEHAEELVCDMVNEKITHSDYFIEGHFDSITDIKDAFDKQYEHAKFSQIDCMLIRLRQSQFVNPKSDEYVKYMQTIVKIDESKRSLMEMFWDEHDVFEHDRMVASVVHHLHPEIDYRRLYPCLRNEDLSPESVLGQTLPPAPEIQYLNKTKDDLIFEPVCESYDQQKLQRRIEKSGQTS